MECSTAMSSNNDDGVPSTSFDKSAIAIGHKMSAVMTPRTIALVGATEREGAVGKTMIRNILESYKSQSHLEIELFPINPTKSTICGKKCFAKVSDVPVHVDMALVVVPAKSVPDVVRDCGKKEVDSVVVISAGFKETGAEGAALEQEIVELCKASNMRLVGPNCLGVMNPCHGLNATFAACEAPRGSVAFISQSGAMCTACLDWALDHHVGFSAFISIGSMGDIEWSDVIQYLKNDENTKAIIIYMESIGNAQRFMQAAKSVTECKPIVIIKSGRTTSAAEAAVSHTGSLAGSHDAFLAAMGRVGVTVVDTIDELYNATLLMDKQPRPIRQGVTIITNAGGPGVITTDASELAGIPPNPLSDALFTELDKFLPEAWSRHNPIDLLGDASHELYARTLRVTLDHSSHTGAIVVVLSPQSVTEPTATASKIIESYDNWRSENPEKVMPVVCSWMGGPAVAVGTALLNEAGIPCFSSPDSAVRALGTMFREGQAIDAIRGLPLLPSTRPPCDQGVVMDIIRLARSETRTILTESESKKILRAYGIQVADSIICQSDTETADACVATGFPCVIKLNSETITHKSDIGGVKLNINSQDQARVAFDEIQRATNAVGSEHFHGVSVQPMIDISKGTELVFGSLSDNQFGPICLFGMGGTYVEIFKDTTLAVPPLTDEEAKRMISRTKISNALKQDSNRYKGCNMAMLEEYLVKFSWMTYDLYKDIAECDINPVLALPDRTVALDARIVLTDPTSSPQVPCLAHSAG